MTLGVSELVAQVAFDLTGTGHPFPLGIKSPGSHGPGLSMAMGNSQELVCL